VARIVHECHALVAVAFLGIGMPGDQLAWTAFHDPGGTPLHTEWEQDAAVIVQRCAQGQTDALNELLRRRNAALVRRARRLMRRLGSHPVGYEASDAVNTASLELCRRVRRGELQWMRSSADFSRVFLSLLRAAVRYARDRYASAKRGGPGARPLGCRDRRQEARRAGAQGPPRGYQRVDVPLDSLSPDAPASEKLADARLQIEAFLKHLGDATARKIVTMRLEDYSCREIARRLGVSRKTVERKLALVRRAFAVFTTPT
jgi:RNA polymerase sigma factor (sigma-70 family)